MTISNSESTEELKKQCKSCNSPHLNTADYCSKCGAKIIRNRLTFKNLLGHFAENFFNYDNKLLKTFWHLIIHPEWVINGFISGVRKRYINPVNYFAIAVTLIGIQMFIVNRYFPHWFDIAAVSVEGTEEMTAAWMNTVLEYQSLVFMINIPIYAAISWLAFYTLRKYNYTEFIVFFLYTVTQMSFLLIIPQFIAMFFGRTLGEMSFWVILIQIFYTSYCFKRVFNLSIKGIILRFLWLIGILIILYIIAILIFLGIMIATGSMDEFIEAQKQMQEAQGP
ncbi:MAG: DUF3667 domain-containing protein [Bacteroidia bacterium]|nr:DUF3667 domain-containing protein [Bacteroidia bacterium]